MRCLLSLLCVCGLFLSAGCDGVLPTPTSKISRQEVRERPFPEPPPTKKVEAKKLPSEVKEIREEKEEKEPEPEDPPPVPTTWAPLNKNRTLFLENPKGGQRKVHILAEVCLREGQLEVLMCKAKTKEHEAILSADLDARDIHASLIAAGAKPGAPVQFFNHKTMKEEFKPAHGTKILVTLTYRRGGKLLTSPAQEWIRDAQTKKDMPYGWVFGGSRFFKNPDKPDDPDYYCANNGEIISIANFIDSMLDLPVKSPREAADILFEANTTRIPPRGTKVLVTLEPVLEAKKNP